MSNLVHMTDVRIEAEWRRYRRDEEAFLRECWYIPHPSRGRILFDLREAQVEGLQHWNLNRYSLTLKARQIGWSTLVGGHQFHRAFFRDDQKIIDISRTERESIDLAGKSKYGYAHLPEWLRERGPSSLTDHLQKMVFANGSSIVSLPSAQDPARGSSASLIVVDEWAFLPNADAAWGSIEPVADVGGSVIGLSTANGSGNFFHRLWVDSQAGRNEFATYFAPWSANGERDENWYRTKKRSMPSWQLAQEYPTTPEEAFIKSGNPVFDIDLIERLRVAEPLAVGHLHLIGA